MPMDAEALYAQLGRLVETMPSFSSQSVPPETHHWLGRAGALIAAAADDRAEIDLFREAVSALTDRSTLANDRLSGAQRIMAVVYRALAAAELRAPVATHGAFIPVGNAFDAMAAVAKVLGPAQRDVLIVDPYMDEKALTDFAPLSPEGVAIRLLADQSSYKPTLGPAQHRWGTQYGASRPLSVRLAPARTLHDRLIIVDASEAWVLTQSLNAFAVRAPASIVRVDAETAALKVAAYQDIWNDATPL